ncbi:hypothetical protein PAHAL_3G104700 [Panicum hallii]|uniref:Uncharacterized protein n=1 Tax=Panicum hallii TaxID=206008 RepID=A0A2T8KHS1_9POAL|nr:hypothetical protein PAHAL_3G104700 [Panicum hallii]
MHLLAKDNARGSAPPSGMLSPWSILEHRDDCVFHQCTAGRSRGRGRDTCAN